MAIAIFSTTFTACNETDKGVEKPTSKGLYARGISQDHTQTDSKVIFDESNIEWFNVTTREIKFKDMPVPLFELMEPFNEIEFVLDDDILFVVNSFVGLWDSRVFYNLVLCYGNQESVEINGKYYLYDCYPLQLSDSEVVKTNQEKNKSQWETFLKHLESKGKLRK